MPIEAYISVTGEKQGNITSGSNTEKGMGTKFQQNHADESTVIGFSHNIKVPTHPQAGTPAGSRIHKPIVITKFFDKASPGLYKALSTGEALSDVVIKFYRISKDGVKEHYYTYTLTDAILVEMDSMMELTTDESLGYREHEERWYMTYRKIEWKHEKAGTIAIDNWRDDV